MTDTTVSIAGAAVSFGHPGWLPPEPIDFDAYRPLHVAQGSTNIRATNFRQPSSVDLVHVSPAFMHNATKVSIVQAPATMHVIQEEVLPQEEYDFGDPMPVKVSRDWFEHVSSIGIAQDDVDVLAELNGDA